MKNEWIKRKYKWMDEQIPIQMIEWANENMNTKHEQMKHNKQINEWDDEWKEDKRATEGF